MAFRNTLFASRFSRSVAYVLSLSAVAATVAFETPSAQAATLSGLAGEVWFNTDPYTGLPGHARTQTNILDALETSMRARAADGSFVATALNYPQGADTVSSSSGVGGQLSDFLGSDHASFTLNEGASIPAQPLRQSVWRFTGTLLLSPLTSYDFRITSDDGNAIWLGHDAGSYPELPTVAPISFLTSGAFPHNRTEFTFTTGADGQEGFKMLFYERFGNTGLRLDFRETGTSDFRVLAGNVLAHGNSPAPIPLPAAGWLLVTALGGMGLIGRLRRNRSR